MTDRRYPVVIFRGETGAGIFLSVHYHTSKLYDFKYLLMNRVALLLVEHRSLIVRMDQYSDHKHYRRCKNDAYK